MATSEISSANSVAKLLAENNLVLGPMAGVTEAPFRAICKRFGAGLTYTEMVSARGLHFTPRSRAAHQLLTLAREETPCAIQIYGSDPEMMAEQAAVVCERHGSDVALVDINMGCPVTKVVARGEGSALMLDPDRAAAIVERMVAEVPVPVTVKFRKGWDERQANAVEFARAMEAAGASAVAVHGRTRGQFYQGHADWDSIAAVKRAISVPVIGSGDVFCAADAQRMLDRTGADAVMIARGAQGNPWIFREARALIDSGTVVAPPSHLERVDMAREHMRALVAFAGEAAVVRMRRHVTWYVTGMPGATYLRGRVNSCTTPEALDGVLGEYRAYLESR